MKEINDYMEESKTIIEGLLKLIVETSICLDKIPEYHTQTFNRGCVFTNNYNLIKEVMQISKKHPIMLWRFEEAPDELQKLSTNGGDEDWLAEIPPAYFKDCDYFGPLPVYGLYNTGHEDPEEVPHPFKEGWKVRIGSHA